jgi:hypothetical protein
MSSMRRLFGVVVVVVVIASWVSCGGATADGVLTPTGGEVCLPDRKVCISVPTAALEDQEVVRIGPSNDKPGGALSDAYDIASASGRPITFLKPATVSFSLDIVTQTGVENQNLLRIYTRDGDGDWQPLDNAFVDRVRNVVIGETRHLSPFVVLRSDRLPDGGLPIELDGGARDSGVIVVPPFDGGPEDAGFDAGRPDAGRPDAGVDAGIDAGTPDSGTPDAGTPDAGFDAGFDAGTPDAGFDAGTPDAGFDAGVDAGFDAGVDAGFDAGVDAGFDAGFDAGEPDAGDDAGVDAGEDAG